MKTKLFFMAGLLAVPLLGIAASPVGMRQSAEPNEVQARQLTEADRKVTAGRILLKWGGYVEKVNGQNRRAWAASLWPSLASADLDNLQKASRAVTYEGMRNALLGQRPYDDQIIDRMARLPKGSALAPKTLGNLTEDLVFTPIAPCRIVDTRVPNDRIGIGAIRELDASNPGGNFTSQGGSNTNCGIPANPAALALSVTGLGNLSTGFLRVYPHNGTNAQGSPVPLNTVNTTVTNDMIVPACQGCAQELRVFSTANTHYAAFVTGYFMAPEITQVQCTTATAVVNIPANNTGAAFASCPAAYTATGGGCNSNVNSNAGGVIDSYPSGNTSWYCRLGNTTAVAGTGSTYVRCCRVPGR